MDTNTEKQQKATLKTSQFLTSDLFRKQRIKYKHIQSVF